MPEMPDAIVLCGGAGLRLRSVTAGGPKSMAGIAGRPFLELLLQQLRRNGFERVILAVGYQRDAIREHFGDRAFDLNVAYSVETSPLGTGGAVGNAADVVSSKSVLVMNGDSYTGADLRAFVADYEHSGADASILAVPVDDRSDCGTLATDANGRLTKFAEKEGSGGTPFLNAGIYMMSRAILDEIAPGVPASLERELFPGWLAANKNIRLFLHEGTCVDIGTPERYQVAQQALASAEAILSTAGEAIQQ